VLVNTQSQTVHAWSVFVCLSVCVCWIHRWVVQKRINRSKCRSRKGRHVWAVYAWDTIGYIWWSDITESMATIRSSFCGYNTAYCVELMAEDFSCYLNNIQSAGLWKCLYDHLLVNKAYYSNISVKKTLITFTHNMAAKASWHRNYVTVTLCTLCPENVHLFIFLIILSKINRF